MDVARTTSQAQHKVITTVCPFQQCVPVLFQDGNRLVQVWEVEYLNLPDHHGVGHFCPETTAGTNQLGGVADGGNDTWLLHRHGDQVITIVDLEVDGDTQRECEGADHVFDHVVRLLES